MKRFALFAAGLLAAAAQPALAQTSPNLSGRYTACMARAGGNVVQQDVCEQAETGAQDDRLNKAYQQVMAQKARDPAAKSALRAQARAWIKERDYSCKLNRETVDGGCIVTKTALRADELEAQVRF